MVLTSLIQEHWRKTHSWEEGRTGGFGLGDVGPARGAEGISNQRCQVDSWLFEYEAQRSFLMKTEIGGLHKIKEDET